MKKTLLLLACVSALSVACAQSGIQPNDTVINQNSCAPEMQAKEGTFEFIPLSIGVSDCKEEFVHEVFTTDVLCLIEANRKENEYVTIQLSSYTKVRIYPSSIIVKQ